LQRDVEVEQYSLSYRQKGISVIHGSLCFQARSYEEATSSVLGWYMRHAQTRALSHPLPVMRAREIDRWAQSAQFKSLVARNRQQQPSAGRI
jgi:hypothetical protein